ncbi:MAG: response regulator [Nitrospirae bacterium]|nr:response regulator [Nitrospirota bacterium]
MNGKEKVLVIDDELMPRYSMQQVLKDRYSVLTATGGIEGLESLENEPPDLVVLDIKMPDMDGVTVLREIKKRHPDIEVVLLTAYASIESARDAVRFGAIDYLMKPFDKDDLLNVVERGLKKKREREIRRLEHEELLGKTGILERQIVEVKQNLMMSYEGTVKALLLAIDAKDQYTAGHSEHVARLSHAIGEAMGLPEEAVESLRQSALIHDIGKIGVDETILKKRGPLIDEEFKEIRRHPEIGGRIVSAIPFLEEATMVIVYHHEKFNGTGFPAGLKGEEIPPMARIVTVADAIDAMMRDRPYRKRLPADKILSELLEGSGTQFDPAVVDIVIKKGLIV